VIAVEHPPDLTLLAFPFFVTLIGVEQVVLRHRARRIDGRDFWASIGMGFGSTIPINLFMGFVGWWFATLLWDHRLVDLGTGWAGWLVAMVGWDLIFYVEHRLSHEVRFFWASHVNHHSSLEYNLSTALRQPWTAFHTPLMVAPLALVGVRPDLIVVSGALNLLYQFWIHTEMVGRLGPLERVLNTPSHHRVHHGSNPRYLDKNYGGILIVWDRLFGTFAEEVHRPTYGLTQPVVTRSVLGLQYREFGAIARDVRRAAGWRERVGYLLRPPGWRPATPEPASGP